MKKIKRLTFLFCSLVVLFGVFNITNPLSSDDDYPDPLKPYYEKEV
ncbi:hypothetical protein [Paucisalibacillus sp. EB02]|nr:hypothetical protein [Paucisalibacillus sp. EB02]